MDQLINCGIAYANYAVQCDHGACATNDPIFFQRAAENYRTAISQFSEALNQSYDRFTRQLLHEKITKYSERLHVLEEWLKSYNEKKDKRTSERWRRGLKKALAVNRLLRTYEELQLHDSDENIDNLEEAKSDSVNASSRKFSSTDHQQNIRMAKEIKAQIQEENETVEKRSMEGRSGVKADLNVHVRIRNEEPISLNSKKEKLEDVQSPVEDSQSPNESSPMVQEGQKSSSFPQGPSKKDIMSLGEDDSSNVVLNAGKKTSTPKKRSSAVNISNDLGIIPVESSKVEWDDIAGYSEAKNVLMELFGIPSTLYNALGAGYRPWNSILLYGPSGSGKTFLLNAAMSQSEAALFPVTVETLVGDRSISPESAVRTLFLVAKNTENSVILLSNVDIIFSRSGAKNVSENLRRALLQLLREVKALRNSNGGTLLIGTSSAPWDVDESFMSCIQQKIYIGLPDLGSRVLILEKILNSKHHDITIQEIEDVARECDNYNVVDLYELIGNAEAEIIRRVRNSKYFIECSETIDGNECKKLSPCDEDEVGAKRMNLEQVVKDLRSPTIGCLELEMALEDTKPSISTQDIAKFEEFTKTFGRNPV